MKFPANRQAPSVGQLLSLGVHSSALVPLRRLGFHLAFQSQVPVLSSVASAGCKAISSKSKPKSRVRDLLKDDAELRTRLLPVSNKLGCAVAVLTEARVPLVSQRHCPVVYDQSLLWMTRSASLEELTVLADTAGSIHGLGLYNARSRLYRLRLLWHTSLDGELEEGGLNLRDILVARLQQAVGWRNTLGLPSPQTNAFRLVNAEGDRLSGLIVDVYDKHAVVSSNALWVELHGATILRCLAQVMGRRLEELSWRVSLDRLNQDGVSKAALTVLSDLTALRRFKVSWPAQPEGALTESPEVHAVFHVQSWSIEDLFPRDLPLAGDQESARAMLPDKVLERLRANPPLHYCQPDTPLQVKENGLLYEFKGIEGQKTGLYCDHRENRLATAALSAGKTVLDCFSYCGSFGLNAARAGAADVVCVDSSETALQLAQKNSQLNELSHRMTFIKADVLTFLRAAVDSHKKWDIVVVDPPKLAPNRRSLRSGLKLYKQLNNLAIQVVTEGGILVSCSCSSAVAQRPGLLLESILDAKPKWRDLRLFRTSHAAPCHLVHPEFPESNYLQALFFQVV